MSGSVNTIDSKICAIVVGASAGGLNILNLILNGQKPCFPVPIIICVHLSPSKNSILVDILQQATAIPVKEAEDKEIIAAGQIYVAPPGYHLMVEKELIFSLSADAHVNHARPAIDVLFETAADAYRECLLGILLTGASHDGAYGLKVIQNYGGIAMVQNPETAEHPVMPQAGLNYTNTSYSLAPVEIQRYLAAISK